MLRAEHLWVVMASRASGTAKENFRGPQGVWTRRDAACPHHDGGFRWAKPNPSHLSLVDLKAVTLRTWTGIGEVIPPAVEEVKWTLGEQSNRS